MPSYGYLDVRASKNFKIGDLSWTASVNVQNVLDNIYISDGFETFFTDPFTGERQQGTVENGRLEGYWSYGRTISASLKMRF